MDSAANSPNCTICLEPVVQNYGRSTARLQCNHVFHLDCIGSEFNAKGAMQCPNCRKTEDGQWLFAGGNFDESIQSEEEEIMEMQRSQLLWCLLNGFDYFPSPIGYQVLPEVPSLPYERNTAATIRQTRVSGHRSPQLPLARVPVWGVMNHVVMAPPPSPRVDGYTIAPFSGFLGANGMSGLHLPHHTFFGPSNDGHSLGPAVAENETSESYGYTMFQFF